MDGADSIETVGVNVQLQLESAHLDCLRASRIQN